MIFHGGRIKILDLKSHLFLVLDIEKKRKRKRKKCEQIRGIRVLQEPQESGKPPGESVGPDLHPSIRF